MRLSEMTAEQVADLTCTSCRKPKKSTRPWNVRGLKTARRLCAQCSSDALLKPSERERAAQYRRAFPWLVDPSKWRLGARRPTRPPETPRPERPVDQRELF